MNKTQFNVHWICRNKKLQWPFLIHSLPRVGDEIRRNYTKFYIVKKIVWCLDEPADLGVRVNIEVFPN